jgi:hypothetical protein
MQLIVSGALRSGGRRCSPPRRRKSPGRRSRQSGIGSAVPCPAGRPVGCPVLAAGPPAEVLRQSQGWLASFASCQAGGGRSGPSWAPGSPAAPWPTSDRRSCRHAPGRFSSTHRGSPPGLPSHMVFPRQEISSEQKLGVPSVQSVRKLRVECLQVVKQLLAGLHRSLVVSADIGTMGSVLPTGLQKVSGEDSQDVDPSVAAGGDEHGPAHPKSRSGERRESPPSHPPHGIAGPSWSG